MSKIITHIVGSFYPAIEFGGPIFSTKRICDVILKEEAYDIEVISFNYKTPRKDSFLTTNDVEYIESTKKYNIKWINMKSKISGFIFFNYRSIISINKTDIVHLTGVFNLYALITVFLCFLFQKKLIISGRGSLQALYEFGEVKNKKIKSIYLKLLKLFLNEKRCFWLATTKFEAQINISFIDLPYFIATNPVDIKKLDSSYFNRVNGISFLSRFSPKKGIERFINVARLLNNTNVAIAGDGDLELKNKVLDFVQSRENATYLGVVRGEQKDNFYKSSDILVLLSYSENFGIVIAEALSSGCSVLTTVNEPWINYCLSGVLHVLPVNSSDEELKNEIEKIQNLRKNNLKEIVSNASNIVRENFSIEVAHAQVVQMYNSILKH